MPMVKVTPVWQAMVNTVEGTQWHREDNVAVHTEMTMNHFYEVFYAHRTPRQQFIALLSLLCHDFGKPPTERTNPKTGKHQYLGHEPVSGSMMLDFFRDHPEIYEEIVMFGYGDSEIAAARFIIDNHLPYGMRQPKKVQALKDEIEKFLGEDAEVFYDVLRSDSAGRIMDNRESRLAEVEGWIEQFQKTPKWIDTHSPEYRAARKAEWLAKHTA